MNKISNTALQINVKDGKLDEVLDIGQQFFNDIRDLPADATPDQLIAIIRAALQEGYPSYLVEATLESAIDDSPHAEQLRKIYQAARQKLESVLQN